MTHRVLEFSPGTFFRLHNDLIEVHGTTLGPIAIAVYAVLAHDANRKTSTCYPAIPRIARLLGIARSTVKIALRKLVDADVIEVTPRRDPAGDPTSNLYTLLDPSPAAVEVHRREREASALGGGSADILPHAGGGSADDPPSAGSQPTGRSADDPEPKSSLEPKEENQLEDGACAEEPKKSKQGNPCPHPSSEVIRSGEGKLCMHCWTMIKDQTSWSLTPAGDHQEDRGVTHAHAA